MQPVLLLLSALTALAAPTIRKPNVSNGAERYSPTKCEWMAVELNSNFRVSNIKTGFTLQFFCRPPNTIFLSYQYLTEADRDAAQAMDDTVREAIGQVVRARGWRWVKVDGSITKFESGGKTSPAASSAAPSGASVKPKPAAPSGASASDASDDEW